MGDEPRARRHFEQALLIHREECDRPLEAKTLANLGWLYVGQNQKRAREYLERAIEIFRDVGDQVNEASALFCLAKVREREGRIPEAVLLYEQGVKITEVIQQADVETHRVYLQRLRNLRSRFWLVRSRVVLIAVGLVSAVAVLWYIVTH